MGFPKGNKLGGRKGYGFEFQQMERMKEMIGKYLDIMDKIFNKKADNDDWAILQTLGPDIRKILDKVHASKTESKIEDSTPRLTQNIVVLLDKIYGRKRIIRNVDEGSERLGLPPGSV